MVHTLGYKINIDDREFPLPVCCVQGCKTRPVVGDVWRGMLHRGQWLGEGYGAFLLCWPHMLKINQNQ